VHKGANWREICGSNTLTANTLRGSSWPCLRHCSFAWATSMARRCPHLLCTYTHMHVRAWRAGGRARVGAWWGDSSTSLWCSHSFSASLTYSWCARCRRYSSCATCRRRARSWGVTSTFPTRCVYKVVRSAMLARASPCTLEDVCVCVCVCMLCCVWCVCVCGVCEWCVCVCVCVWCGVCV
jgi:hypothetical protein